MDDLDPLIPSIQTEKSSKNTVCGCDRNLYNILVMSFAFLLTFSGYNTTQSFATKLLPGSLGSLSIGLLYCVFSFANFGAPVITRRLGPKMAMTIGALGYFSYIASLIYLVSAVVLFCAILIGLGAAVIWTSQGVFLTQNSNSTNRGYYSGLFWGILQLSTIPGNLASYFLLSSEDSPKKSETAFPMLVGWSNENSIFFVALASLTFGGACFFFLLKSPSELSGSQSYVAKNWSWIDVKSQLKSTFMLLGNKRLALLCPLMFYSGLGVTFYAGWFTRQQHKKYLGLCMIGLGVAEAAGGIILGRISDRIGRTPIIIFGFVAQVAALVVCWIANDFLIDNPSDEFLGMRYFFVAGPILGIADCAFQTQIMAAVSSEHTEKSAEAFAIYKLMQSLGATVGFFTTPLFGTSIADKFHFRLEIGLTMGLMLIGIVFYLVMLTVPLKSNLRQSLSQHY